MPGTILVSVLELNGLPFPSPPSSTSMKVSMGNREYQAGDKGDFSFPLTTLRENLVIVVHDSEGNEISHGGVETKSIVERGLWDDIFSLEGGGQIRMKLRFVLDEDEKNRIRKMREAALKRKQGRPIDFRANLAQVPANAGIKLSSYVFPENADTVEEKRSSSAVTLAQKLDIQPNRADSPMESVWKVEELSSPTPSKSVSGITSAEKLDIQPSRADSPMESVWKVEAQPLSSPTPSKSISAVTSAQKLDIQPSRADPPMESVQKVEARPVSPPTPSKSVSAVTSAQKLDIQLSRADSPTESVWKVEARPLSSPMPSQSVSAVTSAQKLDVQPSRADPPVESVRKFKARPLSSPTPSKSVNLTQSLSLTKGPASGSSSKKRPSLERSPSSVKRMIMAFESSRFQDNKPQIKATVDKQRVSKVGVYSKEKETESKEPMESRATVLKEKGVDIKLKEVEKGDDKPREDFIANQPIETSSSSETSLHGRDEQSDDTFSEPGKTSIVRRISTHESRISHEKVTDIKADEVEKDNSKPREDSITNLTIETSSASENSLLRHDKQSDNVSSEASKTLIVKRILTHESRKTDNYHEKDIYIKPKELETSSALENSLHQHDEHRGVVSLEPSKSSITTRTSIHESEKTDKFPENMVNGYEESGAWIFPDQQRHATTSGEKFMDLVRVHGIESEEKTIVCVSQKIGDDRESETPKRESEDGSEPSTCLFGKVLKVGIMIGFGALVIFTRQRNRSR